MGKKDTKTIELSSFEILMSVMDLVWLYWHGIKSLDGFSGLDQNNPYME